MVDVVDSTTRSRMMAGMKSKDTRPEMVVRRFLHSEGFRYRLHVSNLPGKPDIVLPKYKVAIFVHGCFWHRHKGCKYTTNPDQNKNKWQEKFRQNIERDEGQVTELINQGWRVIVVWECGLRASNPDLAWLVAHIMKSHSNFLEWPKSVDVAK